MKAFKRLRLLVSLFLLSVIYLDGYSDVAPVINSNTVSISENCTIGFLVSDINEATTGTDKDPDGQSLTYSITAGNELLAFAINASTGEVTVVNSAPLIFSTNPLFILSISATDGINNATAQLTISLIQTSGAAPVAIADFYSVGLGKTLNVNSSNGVLKNDNDIDSPTLRAVLVTAPSYGNLTLNDDGSFTYIHTGGTNANDQFTYYATDGLNNSTPVSVTLYVTSSTNNYNLSFDGSSSYIHCNTSTSGDLGYSDFTLEAWVKTSQTTGSGAIISNRYAGSNGYFYSLSISNGLPSVEIDGGGGGYYLNFLGKKLIADGTWHHVALVHSGVNNTLYVDGLPDSYGKSSYQPYVSSGFGLMVGARNADGEYTQYFQGDIDEVRVWAIAQSANSIKGNMYQTLSSGTTGLYVYYPLNETPTTGVYDASGNGFVASYNALSDTKTSLALIQPFIRGFLQNPNQLTFFWDKVPGATEYEYWVDDNSDFSSPIFAASTTADTFKTFTISPLKTYYVKVAVSAGASEWSSVRSYSVPIDLSNGLSAYFPFDGNTKDSTQTFSLASTPSSYSFDLDKEDNTNRAVTIADVANGFDYGNSPLQTTNDITVCAWIKTDHKTGSWVMSKYNGKGWILGFMDATGSIWFDMYDDASKFKSVHSSSSVADGNWHFIVGQRRDTMLRIFVDGQKVDSLAISDFGSITNNTANLKLGYAYNGSMDEARVYDRALSTAEIASIYLIERQPKDMVACLGSSTGVRVKASQAGCTFQWQQNVGSAWVDISEGEDFKNVTSDSLLINTIYLSEGEHPLRCVVSKNGVAVTSNEFKLVNQPISIVQSTTNYSTVCYGSSQTISLQTIGSGYSYQWQKQEYVNGVGWQYLDLANGTEYSGVNTSNFELLNVTGYGTYRCKVSLGSCTDYSTDYYVYTTSTYLMQMYDQQMCEGLNASFAMSGTFKSGTTFSWEISSDKGSSWATLVEDEHYRGVNTQILGINNLLVSMSNTQYRVVVNECSAITSNAATLKVYQPLSSIGAISGETNLMPGLNNIAYRIADNTNIQYTNWLSSDYNTISALESSPLIGYYSTSSTASSSTIAKVKAVAYNTCNSSDTSFLTINLSSTFVPASKVQANGVSPTSELVSWTRGNGTACAVFVSDASVSVTPIALPQNNVSYNVGDQISGTNWTCVYNGPNSWFMVNDLLSNHTYRVHVVEYTGSVGAEHYITYSKNLNPVLFTTPSVSFKITTMPQAKAVNLGDAFELSVETTGDYSSVVWNWTNGSSSYALSDTGSLVGTHTKVLNINSAKKWMNGWFYCTVYDANYNGVNSDQALVQVTIPYTVSLKDHLLAYYPFDGGSTRDEVSGYEGVNTDAVSTTGYTNDAFYFNETSSNIGISNTFTSSPDSFSFSTYINTPYQFSNMDGYLHLITLGGVAQMDLSAKDNGDDVSYKLYFTIRKSESESINATADLSYDVSSWHFVSATFKKGIALNLYIDGVLVSSTDLTSNPSFSPGYVAGIQSSVGAYDNGVSTQYFYKGFIDEIRIHDRYFTANEIKEIADRIEISTQARDTSVCAGSQPSFVVKANRANTQYIWQYNNGSGWKDIDINDFSKYGGYRSSNLWVKNATSSQNNYQFRCVVQTSNGIAVSNAAKLVVAGAVITKDLAYGVNTCSNLDTKLSVETSGTGYTYEWFFRDANIYPITTNKLVDNDVFSGSTTNELTVKKGYGNYSQSLYCEILDPVSGCRVMSNTTYFSTGSTIRKLYGDTIVCIGSSANLNAIGSYVSSYQFEVSGDEGSSWSAITSDANYTSDNGILTINNVSNSLNNNLFRCKLGGQCSGNEYTNQARLVVQTPQTPSTLDLNGPRTVQLNSYGLYSVSANKNYSYTWSTLTANISNTSANTYTSELNFPISGITSLVITPTNACGFDFDPQTFSLNVLATAVQAKALTKSFAAQNSIGLSWTRGSGDSCIVFVKKNATSYSLLPIDGKNYYANTNFGSGSEISGTGWYAVYKGKGTSTNVAGLTSNTYCRFVVLEYSNPTGLSPAYFSYTLYNSNLVDISTALQSITISQQPVSVTVNEGENATLNASFTGDALNVIWQRNVYGYWSDIYDTTFYRGALGTSKLTILKTSLSLGGAYRLSMYDHAKMDWVYSDSVFVTVIPNLSVALSDGLVAYYPFNGNTNDLSGNNFNGTAVGSPSLVKDSYGNDPGTYRLNSNQHIRIPNSLGANPDEYTISFKFRNLEGNVPSSNQTLLYLGSMGKTSIDMYTYQSAQPFSYINFNMGSYGGGTEQMVSGTIPFDYFWHTITVTFKKGDSVVLYVDSTLMSKRSLSTSRTSYSDLISYSALGCIPTSTGSSNQFLGYIDDVRFYNRAIRPAERKIVTQLPCGIPEKPVINTANILEVTGTSVKIEASLNTDLVGKWTRLTGGDGNYSYNDSVNNPKAYIYIKNNNDYDFPFIWEWRTYNECGYSNADSVKILFHSAESQLQRRLMAYYMFNSNSADSSGNLYDATTGKQQYSFDRKLKASSAYLFNGADSLVASGDLSASASYIRTWAFWFRNRGTVDQKKAIVSKFTPGNTAASEFAIMLEGKNVLATGNGIDQLSAPLDTTKWNHIIVTFHSGTGRSGIYVNGISVASGTLSFNNQIAYNKQVVFGAMDAVVGNNSFLNGYLDDVLVYERDLNSKEIALLASGYDPLVPDKPAFLTGSFGGSSVYLDWDRGAVTQQFDIYRGVSNTLSLVGTADYASFEDSNIEMSRMYRYMVAARNSHGTTHSDTIIISTYMAAPGKALYSPYEGLTYLELAPDSRLSFTASSQPYTLEAWFKPDYIRNSSIISKNSTESGYSLSLASDSALVFDGLRTKNGLIEPGVWHHVAATNESKVRHLYVDGLEVSLQGTVDNVIGNAASLTIGYSGIADSQDYFWGSIDEVRIWNTARSLTQIKQFLHAVPTGSEAGLVLYWNMDQYYSPTITDLSANGFVGTLVNAGSDPWTNSGAVINAFAQPAVGVNTKGFTAVADSVPGAQYTFYFSDNVWFANYGTVINGTSRYLKVDTLRSNTSYYYRVSTVVNGVASQWSNKIEVKTAQKIDLTTGLVAYYPFNSNANDESGNENNGSYSNVDFVTEASNSYVKFKGVYNLGNIIVPPSSSLSFSNQMTISLWARLDSRIGCNPYHWTTSDDNYYCLFSKDGDPGSESVSGLFHVNGESVYSLNQVNGTYLFSTSDIGKWGYYTFIYSSDDSVKLYKNGILVGKAVAAINWSSVNTKNLRFGVMGDDWYMLDGALDEIRVYNRVLKVSEIDSLYRQGGLDSLVPSTPTGESLQTFCKETSPTVANLVVIGTDIRWYNSENTQLANSTLLINGATYYATQSLWGVESAKLKVTASVILCNGPRVNDTVVYISPTTLRGTAIFDVNDYYTLDDKDRNGLSYTYSLYYMVPTGPFSVDAASGKIIMTDNTQLAENTSYAIQLIVKNAEGVQVYPRVTVKVFSSNLKTGLVAYYPFTNGNTADSSGYANNGTNNGAIVTKDRFGNANSAFLFNGSSNFITIPASSSINLSTKQLSLSAWVNLSSTGGYQQVLSKAKGVQSSDREYGLYLANGNPAFEVATDKSHKDVVAASSTIVGNNWFLLTAVYDSSSMNYYVDGNLVFTVPQYGQISNLGSNLVLGMFADKLQSPLNGRLDDVRVYNRALNSFEVFNLYHAGGWPNLPAAPVISNLVSSAVTTTSANLSASVNYSGASPTVWLQLRRDSVGYVWYNTSQPYTLTSASWTVSLNSLKPKTSYQWRLVAATKLDTVISNVLSFKTLSTNSLENGLVAYYPFNGDALDYSGYGNDGVNHGANFSVDRFGNINESLNFDGLTNYVEVSDNDLLDLTGDFCISSWYKTNKFPGINMILSKHDCKNTNGSYTYGLWNDSGNNWINFQAAPVFDNTSLPSNISGLVDFTKWQNFTVVYKRDLKLLQYYLDSKLIESKTLDFTIANTGFPLIIAANNCYNGMTNFFNGSLDDIRIYNRALSPSEISSLYYENGWTDGPVISTTTTGVVNLGASLTLSVSQASNVYLVPASVSGTIEALETSVTDGVAFKYQAVTNTLLRIPTNDLTPGDYVLYAVNSFMQVSKPSEVIRLFEGDYVVDVDNNIYKAITIGQQQWMGENLRAKHFRKGSALQNAQTAVSWVAAGTSKLPSASVYGNNSGMLSQRGRLYNYYSVLGDSLCPVGWRMPAITDWDALRTYLGSDEGIQLKSSDGWVSGDFAGTDTYGFSAIGSGLRGSTGSFADSMQYAYFWSTSKLGSQIRTASLSYTNGDLNLSDVSAPTDGLSVRCMRDIIDCSGTIAYAGADTLVEQDTVCVLRANIGSAFVEHKWFNIDSANGGRFIDRSINNTSFVGTKYKKYRLVWQVKTVCGVSRDTITVQFGDPNAISLNDGLMAWYQLNANFTDSVTNKSASPTGTYSFPSSGNRNARAKQALQLSGSGYFVSSLSSVVTNPFTTTMWFKTASTLAQTLLSTSLTEAEVSSILAPAKAIRMDASGHIIGSVQAYSITSSLAYNDNKWHMVTMMRYSDTLLLGVDTTLVGTIKLPKTVADIAKILSIGYKKYSTGNEYFNGYVDDIRVYNRTLNKSEVFALALDEQQIVQASNIRAIAEKTSIDLLWKRGTGTSCAVFASVAMANNLSVYPVYATPYHADSNFGSGAQVGASGWYCVYNGSDSVITVSGLIPNTSYRFAVCEYVDTSGVEIYSTSSGYNNPLTVKTVAAPIVINEVAVKNLSCYGLEDGSVVVNAEGGLSNLKLTYNLLKRLATIPATNTTGVFTGLKKGDYTLTISDTIGNLETQSLSITEPSKVSLLNSDIVTTIDTCRTTDVYEGSIRLNKISGGTGSYLFKLSSQSDDEWLPFDKELSNSIENLTSGNYTVVVRDSMLCELTKDVVVGPQMKFQSLIYNSVVSAEVPKTNLIINAGNVASYKYSIDRGLTFKRSNTFDSIRSNKYYIVVEDTLTGCSIDTSISISLIGLVKFKTDTVCQGVPTHLTALTDSIHEAIQGYQWFYDNKYFSYVPNPEFTFTSYGSHPVRLEVLVQSGLVYSITNNVEVRPKPSVSFDTDTVCLGVASYIVNNSVNNIVEVGEWRWEFGDGDTSVLRNPSNHTYARSGVYTVSLTAKAVNGCHTSLDKSLLVMAAPSISVSVLKDKDKLCEGDSTLLEANASGKYQWQWYSNNVEIEKATKKLYYTRKSGEFSVLASSVYKGCDITSEAKGITVYPYPAAAVVKSSTPYLCQGDSLLLSTYDQAGYSYNWMINNFQVASGGSKYYAKFAGIYTIDVLNSIGCTTPAPKNGALQLNVQESPTPPSISLSGSATFCTNDSLTLSINLVSTYKYQWKRDGNVFEPRVTDRYVVRTTGVYSVRVTNQLGCTRETAPVTTRVVEMPTKPVVAIAEAKTLICPGEVLTLSVAQPVAYYRYHWKRNGTALDTANKVSYKGSLGEGEYNVTAEVEFCYNASDAVSIKEKDAPIKPQIYAKGPKVWIIAVSNDSAKAYRWYYNGVLLPNTNSFKYTARQNLGEYYCEINDGGECWTASDVISIPSNTIVSGTEDLAENEIFIYPNPSSGRFTICLAGNIKGAVSVVVSSLNGKVVKVINTNTSEGNCFDVDLTGNSTGLYMAQITGKGFSRMLKLVIQ